jgi:regulator of nucleoside diphosphate kinase
MKIKRLPRLIKKAEMYTGFPQTDRVGRGSQKEPVSAWPHSQTSSMETYESDPGPTAAYMQVSQEPQMTDEYMTRKESLSRPKITLSAADYERLSALARAARNRMPDLAAELADEIGRAEVFAKGALPQHIVCMNSEVQFRDDTTGKVRTVTLVYPEEADISEGKISVMTPVGTALIGLRTGHSITWETPSGEIRQLTVISVRRPHLNEAS